MPYRNDCKAFAERTRFELVVRNDPYVGLANRWFQPLTHLSVGTANIRIFSIFQATWPNKPKKIPQTNWGIPCPLIILYYVAYRLVIVIFPFLSASTLNVRVLGNILFRLAADTVKVSSLAFSCMSYTRLSSSKVFMVSL